MLWYVTFALDHDAFYSQYALGHWKPPLEENNQDPATPTSEEVKQYRAFAKDMLVEAANYRIYMCGMDPLDPDELYFDIFHCDPSLDCDAHIESEFCTLKFSLHVSRCVVIASASMIPRSSSILL